MGDLADVEFADRAIVIDGVVILSDLHLGKDATSNVEWPVGERDDVVDRFEALCEQYDPDEAVVAGDLLHSFQTIPRLVEETLAGLEATADRWDVEIVVIPGNHDTMLETIWNGKTSPEYRIGETLVCHGHVEPMGDADRYVLGHDHPTIEIEGQRHDCYLTGEGIYEGADIIVLPAFNRLLRGVAINNMSATDFMSPMIRDVDALAPVVWDADSVETLTFPPLGKFRRQL